MPAHSALPVKHGLTDSVFHPDEKDHGEDKRQTQNHEHSAEKHIEKPLEPAINDCGLTTAFIEQPAGPQNIEIKAFGFSLEKVNNVRDHCAALFLTQQEAQGKVTAAVVQGNHDLIEIPKQPRLIERQNCHAPKLRGTESVFIRHRHITDDVKAASIRSATQAAHFRGDFPRPDNEDTTLHRVSINGRQNPETRAHKSAARNGQPDDQDTPAQCQVREEVEQQNIGSPAKGNRENHPRHHFNGSWPLAQPVEPHADETKEDARAKACESGNC